MDKGARIGGAISPISPISPRGLIGLIGQIGLIRLIGLIRPISPVSLISPISPIGSILPAALLAALERLVHVFGGTSAVAHSQDYGGSAAHDVASGKDFLP